jgi:hypothetical protein
MGSRTDPGLGGSRTDPAPGGSRTDPGRRAQSAALPSAPIAADPEPHREPTYAVADTRTAAWLNVRWGTSSAFARDVRGILQDGILTLSATGAPLPLRNPMRVMLTHEGLCVECGAAMRRHSPAGASYALDLDPLQRSELQLWLDGYSRR